MLSPEACRASVQQREFPHICTFTFRKLKSLVQEGVNCHVVLFWENAFIVCNDETSILQHIYDAIMHFLYWCLRFDVLYTEMVKLH